MDGGIIPIEHGPLHPAATALARDPGKVNEQRAAIAFAAHFRFHKQVFEIKPGPAEPGGEIVEEDGETDRGFVFESEQHFRAGLFTEQNVDQLFLRCGHIIGGPFISGKIDNQLKNERHVFNSCRPDLEFLRCFVHLSQILAKKTRKVIGNLFVRNLHSHVSFDGKVFSGSDVLITGGLGFIGSALARRLVGLDAKVTLVDSLIPEYGGNLFNIHDIQDRVAVSKTDVRDSEAMASLIKGRHFLFNLAGQTSHLDSMNDPLTDLNINTAAQLSILEACRLHNRDVKIVFASTRQVYGRPQYLPVDEKHPLNPIDVNGINKLAGEWYHLLYNDVYKIRACALRLTNTYGPGMRVKDARQTFLGVWIRNLIEGKSIQLFGDGKQRRDFNFIDDVVEALLLAAAGASSEGQVFNLGHAENISLEELAALLIRLNDGGRHELVPFPPDRKAIDIGDYYGDFGKIDSALGWTPRVSLTEGLKQTLEYYRRNHAHYWEASS